MPSTHLSTIVCSIISILIGAAVMWLVISYKNMVLCRASTIFFGRGAIVLVVVGVGTILIMSFGFFLMAILSMTGQVSLSILTLSCIFGLAGARWKLGEY